ncbi:MAG: hypothetical protein F6K30_09700 [Cyanothece sp. SIO2G6]|nr:hypothetical protein [Cyanothece sp. SIO2G6]
MSKIIRVYCEGNTSSHDHDILEKVIDGLPANVEIVPLGSIRGSRAIVQYVEAKNIVKSHFKVLFRDRDFDKEIPVHEKLERDEYNQYCYYAYRNTIENYLFDTSLIVSFVQKESLSDKYSIQSENDAKNKFIDAAERIKYYQAVRHSMGKMRTGQTNFGTKLTSKSGILPTLLDQEYCKNEGWEKIMQAKSFADSWTENNFLILYQEFIDKFDSYFMENLVFLAYFHGKDFASSLKITLPDFPLKNYYKFAKQHFNYCKFHDLIELRNLIEEHL